ncbi:MAG: DPP IV N-terminal domain-containing protein [Armatimonadetes bacterium]|nr:DPP IV N-terminal domain-containing protein [Armatimonadota bacterium]
MRSSRLTHLLFVPVLLVAAAALAGPTQEPVNKANWKLAARFDSSILRLFVGSSNMTPRFIHETDKFWYSWRDLTGTKFYVVDPKAKKKKYLFDPVKMAVQLSELTHRPYDAVTLPITTIEYVDEEEDEDEDKDDEEKQEKKEKKEKKNLIRFVIENIRYEYDLDDETLKSLGKVRDGSGTQQQGGRGRFGQRRGPGGRSRGYRNFSPDKKSFVFAKDHNLYYVEIVDEEEQEPVQLTDDGEEYYSFGFMTEAQKEQRRQQLKEQEKERKEEEQKEEEQKEEEIGRVRANVTWSEDSKCFYVTRSDSRKVKDLYLVNTLADPRPTLRTYKYAMPGDEEVAQTELFVFDRDGKELCKHDVIEYKDGRLYNMHWPDTSERLRFIRRDRLQRNLGLCEMDMETGEVKVLISESVENAFLERQNVRYVEPGGDMIWFSERMGWGHYYLYDYEGNFKNAITSGPYRAHQIVEVNEKKGLLWFRGYGRETDESPYNRHLYRVKLDGSGLKLLDPGDADHNTSLSPSQDYIIDVSAQVDMEPSAVLRDRDGRVIMELEKLDLSRWSRLPVFENPNSTLTDQAPIPRRNEFHDRSSHHVRGTFEAQKFRTDRIYERNDAIYMDKN